MSSEIAVRSASASDSSRIAALLTEGFGHDYGGATWRPAVQRMMERIHALPGRLNGMFVAVDDQDAAVGVAGLRTTELRPLAGWSEEQITIEELGLGRSFWMELRAELVEPSSYQLQPQEAFIYSVVVTAAWRGRGVGDALLATLHTEAARRGKRRVLLEVVANNAPALRLYARHAYTVVRQRRGVLSLLRLGVPPRLLMVCDLPAAPPDDAAGTR